MSTLNEFIEASKAKGASDEFLAAFLTRRGWPSSQVYTAIGGHWERATGVAAPAPGGRAESARDAFLYLLAFSTLATWAGALGSMLFDFINYWIPDAAARNTVHHLRTAVTWQMASIAVAFPIYLAVMRAIVRETGREPERLQSGVRKWLTYLALLCTAGAMICDLIWFLDYFLMGELTLRFVLKAATVMAIAGAIFAYYRGSLDRVHPRSAAFGAAAAAVVAAAFCVGLGVAGTPAGQRLIAFDGKRVEDLRNIAFAIAANRTAPAGLAELTARVSVRDRQTGAWYEYHAKTGTVYELCATFAAADSGEAPAGTSNFWSHGSGRACFTLDAAKTAPW